MQSINHGGLSSLILMPRKSSTSTPRLDGEGMMMRFHSLALPFTRHKIDLNTFSKARVASFNTYQDARWTLRFTGHTFLLEKNGVTDDLLDLLTPTL
jgi:hypothetical protein